MARYDDLAAIDPSPVVLLNRAVAVAMVSGPEDALQCLDQIDAEGLLQGYHLLHAVRADFYRRLKLNGQAAHCYTQALALVTNTAERRFLERRLQEVQEV